MDYFPLNIVGAATTVVKSGPGKLKAITINTPITGATATIYNNTTATGTKIATITSGATGAQPITLPYDANMSAGITIVTTGIGFDITVTYN